MVKIPQKSTFLAVWIFTFRKIFWTVLPPHRPPQGKMLATPVLKIDSIILRWNKQNVKRGSQSSFFFRKAKLWIGNDPTEIDATAYVPTESDPNQTILTKRFYSKRCEPKEAKPNRWKPKRSKPNEQNPNDPHPKNPRANDPK